MREEKEKLTNIQLNMIIVILALISITVTIQPLGKSLLKQVGVEVLLQAYKQLSKISMNLKAVRSAATVSASEIWRIIVHDAI